jgi:8-oxo-dGTP pyrophosphatase MutT (NUDIX family)
MPTDPLIAAGVILRRATASGDRWLLLRGAKHGEWGFPKGHQDAGESVFDTALRECVEETGIALLAVEGAPIELHYRVPDGRAKTVVYFPAVTACQAVVLSHEHDDGAWMAAGAVQRALPHANLRSLFAAYLRELRP